MSTGSEGFIDPKAPMVAGLGPEGAVAALIDYGIALPASDLFFSSQEKHVAVSVRHLGIVRLLTVLPSEAGRRCISHVKAMAGMDLSEQRRPLDGRWVRDVPNQARVDLRINTVPTLYGEDVAIRLLNSSLTSTTIDDIGFSRREYNEILSMVDSPSGLILVTGPTGSGKTTTLYACLRHLNDGKRKINTIEDPIEFALAGVHQSQVNAKLDVGFPELLRSILRQSPDVIMIGEVRDPTTAEVAVLAANSGHLVLATLHAPIAAGAVQSMLSLGVHAHFLSSGLLGVIAQRLVRTLCPHCKASYPLGDSPHSFDEVQPWLEPGEGEVIFGSPGCEKCHHSGYTDRTGVFEIMRINRELRRMITEGRPTTELRRKAVEDGMLELRRSALLKIARGVTSPEEVLRAIPGEYLGIDE
jgi:type II secretory ATPase GspE/PulE/Tfp pilus assembly ATPase PilB-like protein